MKIVVVGDGGLLFNEFKELDYITLNNKFCELDLKSLDEYDTVINTYDMHCQTSDTASISAMYVYNAEIPAVLSQHCKSTGKKFVHMSTGRVYGNNTIPKYETDLPSVKTPYEAQKLLGEQYCNADDLIIRTVNLFNSEPVDDNKLYCLMKRPSNIDIPISFSHTLDVIRSISRILRLKERGIFNVTSNGLISPFTISPVATYLKKSSIFELNLKENVVNILNTDKLFQIHMTGDVSNAVMECYDVIVEKIRDADANIKV
jgi:dTDP-4-dehydrorhamnose reductase